MKSSQASQISRHRAANGLPARLTRIGSNGGRLTKVFGFLAVVLGAAIAPAAAQVTLFSDSFNSDVASGNTSLSGLGYTVGAEFNDAINTTSNGSIDSAATNGTIGGGNATAGLLHSVATPFNGTTSDYILTATFALSTNKITSSNKFDLMLSNNSNYNGYGVLLEVNSTNSSLADIAILANTNEIGLTPSGILGLTDFSNSFTANTFYTIQVNVGETSASAALFDSNGSMLVSTSGTYNTALGVNNTEQFLDINERDGSGTGIDYFSSLMVQSAPEPAPVVLGGMACLFLGWAGWRRSMLRRA